jgi:hypothetical protein
MIWPSASHQVGAVAVQHARPAGDSERGVRPVADALARRLDADQIATSASSRKGWKRPMAFDPPPTQATRASGSRPYSLQHLRAGFAADHRVESRAPASDTDAARPPCR